MKNKIPKTIKYKINTVSLLGKDDSCCEWGNRSNNWPQINVFGFFILNLEQYFRRNEQADLYAWQSD